MSDNKFDELREALEKVEPEQFAEKQDDTIDITGGDFGSTMYEIDLSSVPVSAYNYCSTGNVTINGGGNYSIGAAGSFSIGSGAGAGFSAPWSNTITTSSSPSLNVTGEANFEGDIKWQGRSLGAMLEKIEDRLAIISEPTPEKLEKFAALKKAYDHYKLMEKLIGEE